MNILRIIKLKHINGDFDSLSDMEKYALSLFNDLEIEYRLDISVVYFNNKREERYFWIRLSDNSLWYSYHTVYEKFNMKHPYEWINYKSLTEIYQNIFNRDELLKQYTVKCSM